MTREASLAIASLLGYEINTPLPSLERSEYKKSSDEIFSRLLCLHVVAACSYGFDRELARQWVKHENLYEALTKGETLFLEDGVGDPGEFKVKIEGAWAIAWALGLVPKLDFARNCDSQFVMSLPNLKTLESSSTLKARVKLRPMQEIFEKCDLAYCLHWAIRQAQLSGEEIPGKVLAYVIVERRRALDWLVGADGWDEVALDT